MRYAATLYLFFLIVAAVIVTGMTNLIGGIL